MSQAGGGVYVPYLGGGMVGNSCPMLGRGCTVRSSATWIMVTSDHPPPVDRMTDRHDYKQYFPATSLAGGKKRLIL